MKFEKCPHTVLTEAQAKGIAEACDLMLKVESSEYEPGGWVLIHVDQKDFICEEHSQWSETGQGVSKFEYKDWVILDGMGVQVCIGTAIQCMSELIEPYFP